MGGLKLPQGLLHFLIKRLLWEPKLPPADHAPGQAGGQALCGQNSLGRGPRVPGLAVTAPQLLLQVVPQDSAGAVRLPARPGEWRWAGFAQLGPGVEDQHQGVVDHRPQGVPLRRWGDPGQFQVGLDAVLGQGLQPDGPELPVRPGRKPRTSNREAVITWTPGRRDQASMLRATGRTAWQDGSR